MEDGREYSHVKHNCKFGCVCDEGQRLRASHGSHVPDRTTESASQELLQFGERQRDADRQAQRERQPDIAQREVEADQWAPLAGQSSLSMASRAPLTDTRAMLEYELDRARRREPLWLDDGSAQDAPSRDSSIARPQKRRRADSSSKDDQPGEEAAKRRRIADRWAVKPKHFDFEISKPKLWVTDEDGDDVLSPWGLKYFDRNPEQLKDMGQVCQDAHHDGKGSERVRHFRIRPGTGPPPELSPAREELLRQRSKQAKNAARERKAREQNAPAAHTLRIGTLFQPVSGWMPVPDDESNGQPFEVYDSEDSAPYLPPLSPQLSPIQSPQSQGRRAARDTVTEQPTSGMTVKQKRGMPIAYCFIPERYRPKPWGKGERMPQGGASVKDDLSASAITADNVKETATTVQKPGPTDRGEVGERRDSATIHPRPANISPMP